MKKTVLIAICALLALTLIACATPAPTPAPVAEGQGQADLSNAPAEEKAAEPVQEAAEPALAPVKEEAPASAPAPETAAEAKLTEQEAKEKAYAAAGLNAQQRTALTRETCKLDREDGRLVYEIEFRLDGMEYEYDIDAHTGEVRKAKQERDDDKSAGKAAKTAPAGLISEEEAAAIALKKVPGATEGQLRMKLEKDDGRWVYEGEIIHEGIEYEFELDAESGNILEWDEEKDD